MISTFAKPVDSFRTTTTSGRGPGTINMTLAQSPGPLPPNRVFRVTAIDANDQILTVLEATGITANILSGLHASVGYSNIELPVDTIIDIRVCARDISELQDAINALESASGGGGGGGGGGSPGGAQGDLQYNDGAGGFTGGGITWDGSTFTVAGAIVGDFSGSGSGLSEITLVANSTEITDGSNYLIFFQSNNQLTQENDFRYNSYEQNFIIGSSGHQGKITLHTDSSYGNAGLGLRNRTVGSAIWLNAGDGYDLYVTDASGVPAPLTCGPLQTKSTYSGMCGIAIQLPVGQTADALQILASDAATVLAAIDKTGTFVCPTIISAANDGAAEAAGVPLFGFYQNGGNVRVRLT